MKKAVPEPPDFLVYFYFNKYTSGSVYFGYHIRFGWVVISTRDLGLPSYHCSKKFGDDWVSADKYFNSVHSRFVSETNANPKGVQKVIYNEGVGHEAMRDSFWSLRQYEWKFIVKVEKRWIKEIKEQRARD